MCKLNNLQEMDKPLKTYNFPRVNYREIKTWNTLIRTKGTKAVIRNLSAKKSPGPEDFTGEFRWILKGEWTSVPLKQLSSKELKQRKHFSNTFYEAAFLWHQNQRHKKTTDQYPWCKNPQQNTSKWN